MAAAVAVGQMMHIMADWATTSLKGCSSRYTPTEPKTWMSSSQRCTLRGQRSLGCTLVKVKRSMKKMSHGGKCDETHLAAGTTGSNAPMSLKAK